jgi:2-haloalkanoic acid dehalogenase type II
MRRYDVLTFDCYGTLVDWDRGIGDALERAARADGLALDRRALLDAYHEIEPVVEAETFLSYRAVLTETARRVAGRLGWSLEAGRAGFLADSLPSWAPFADTNPALDRLKAAGHRLGILSNVDDDLLAGTRRHFTVSFEPELIVTAQQVRAYKPAPAHFETARRRMGAGRWLHVAQSFFHDIAPATALGIPAAWVNRKGEPTPPAALHVPQFPTLAALADWLTAE